MMEFDGNVTRLQGALFSLNTRKMLNKRSSLCDVVEALKEITCSLQDKDKSKITFFMVLNSSLPSLESLKDDEFVGLLTNVTPLIEKEYLIMYLYQLNLQLHFFELIENCQGDLALELLDVIIKKLKEPEDFGTEFLYQLWRSVFVKICKIHKGIHVNYCLEKLLSFFRDIYHLIQKLVVPSMKKGWEVSVRYHIYYFFKTLLFCLKLSKTPSLPENPVYKLSIQPDADKCCSENPVHICIRMIFQDICYIMENLTVDMWMTWSEQYLDRDMEDSAQMVIGGLVHDILEEVKEFDFPPEVLSCLSNLAINKSDAIAKAGIDEIIANVKNSERVWFEALVKHPGLLEKKSIICVISHLELASAEELTLILNTSYEHLCKYGGNEDVDLVRELFLSALKKTPDYSKWLEKVFENYRPNLFKTAQTDDEVIKAFNKMSKDKNMSDIDLISLCVQSPHDTLKRICQIVITGSQPVEFALDSLKELKSPCNVSLSEGLTLLDSILLNFMEEELNEKETRSFVNLIVELGGQHFLGPSFFNKLLKRLKEYLESETVEKAVLSLEIVKVLLDEGLFHVDCIPFLVFMSQVLEHLTWDLKSFSSTKEEGRDLAVRIVALTTGRLGVEEKGHDLEWARGEILKTWEGNQAHFCSLWFPHNWTGSGKLTSLILALVHSPRSVHEFGKFFIGVDELSDSRISVILSLFMLLPVVSFGEWNLIFDRLILALENANSGKSFADLHYDVLDLFGSSLNLLTLNLNREDIIYPCYKYCLRNFMRLVKKHCCSEMKEASLVRTFERIIQLLKIIDDKEKRKSCLEISSSLLVKLIDMLQARNAIAGPAKQMEEFLRSAEMKEAGEALLQRLH